MICVSVAIVLLASKVTLGYVSPRCFGYSDTCKTYIEAQVRDAQQLANRIFKEKSEVTLICRTRQTRDA